jgi:hypothetical protein
MDARLTPEQREPRDAAARIAKIYCARARADRLRDVRAGARRHLKEPRPRERLPGASAVRGRGYFGGNLRAPSRRMTSPLR